MIASLSDTTSLWTAVCRADDIPEDGGACVKVGEKQIAVFHFARRGEWHASDNMCPHRRQMALSRGMIGTNGDEPKVACPFHKKSFSLIDGRCLGGDECAIRIFPVKVENGIVYLRMDD